MKRPRDPDRVREDALDLNYLFYRQQVERALAERAATIEARTSHEVLARMYEKQIEQLASYGFPFPSQM
jgi:hypothetical protein